jgi:hypothetical protein
MLAPLESAGHESGQRNTSTIPERNILVYHFARAARQQAIVRPEDRSVRVQRRRRKIAD